MNTSKERRLTGILILLLLVGALAGMMGCRAFEPEAVVVNKMPDTFIIGAPMEHGGGYYHFHVYWYGSDEDGRVEQFVWAVTDGTIQNEDTALDEEDVRFNPALDANHLSFAQYTTKTDSIFDFQVNDGALTQADITLHMVAKDDFGDFDRTPARLHFFTNALGNPSISFFRLEGSNLIPVPADIPDTVGFGKPYSLTWRGETPNIRGYDPAALAKIDTVYPFDDGLFGYKWQIQGELGGNCVPTLEDCWHPRLFNEATGDSFSYFADVTSLTFHNNNSGNSPFEKLLPAEQIELLVNSVDVAGVEVLSYQQDFSLKVNYDPITRMLNGEQDLSHGDPTFYPYYIRLNDPTQTPYPFVTGDRIPDRTYVVVKALYKDDPRDEPLGMGGKTGIEGFVEGVRQNLGGGRFTFSTETSILDTIPTWEPDANGWYADTLGFLVGPRTKYTFSMVAVDEHGQRDAFPDTVGFEVGYEPCVQCIELLNNTAPSDFPDMDIPCEHGVCLNDTTILEAMAFSPAPTSQQMVAEPGDYFLGVHKTNGSTLVIPPEDDETDFADSHYLVGAKLFKYKIYLHGQDHLEERYSGPTWEKRMLAWRYQVDYACDVFGSLKDGGGVDNIYQPTYGVDEYFSQPSCAVRDLCIYEDTGLWVLRVNVAVPADLLWLGPVVYYNNILNNPDIAAGDSDIADLVFDATTMQLSAGTVQAVAVDQTACAYFPTRPAKYNVFRNVRPSSNASDPNWRTCFPEAELTNIKNSLGLSLGAMESNDGVPVTKHFKIVVQGPGGSFTYERDDCDAMGLK